MNSDAMSELLELSSDIVDALADVLADTRESSTPLISPRRQRDGTVLWVVKQGPAVWDHVLEEWVYDGLNSSRTDVFIKQTRSDFRTALRHCVKLRGSDHVE